MPTVIHTIARDFTVLQKKIHALQIGVETFAKELIRPRGKNKPATKSRKNSSAGISKRRRSKSSSKKKNKSLRS